mmetsp:Transcript_48560/g.140703  ORF Transcript_48560/g.140703 Transcript_48560/m.140703 type:complete len:344 (-) Transcript_48560:56-1087(-)
MAIPHLRSVARLVQVSRRLSDRRPKPLLSGQVVLWLNTFVCIQFLVGSYFFFTWLDPWAVYCGDWLFITASFINCLICGCLTVDHVRERRYFQREADHARDDEDREKALNELEEKGQELMESVSYFVSSVIFAVGCVLFYPHLFSDEKHAEYGEEIGAFMFIIGSFGFVVGAFWNSMAMVKAATVHVPKVGSTEYRRRQVMAAELFMSLMGSVLFVTGSFLYRPSYATNCDHESLAKAAKAMKTSPAHVALLRRRSSHAILGAPPPADDPVLSEDFQGLCVNVMNQGTLLYVLGSILFILQCLLGFWRRSLTNELQKQEERQEHAEGDASGEALLKKDSGFQV